MRGFALSLIGIFLPIYIFQLSQGYLIFSDNLMINGFTWILVYHFLSSISAVAYFAFFTNQLFLKLNFRRSILLSLLILAGQVILWLLAEKNLYFMLIAGMLSGAIVFLYWLPYHISFVRKTSTKDGNFGAKTGFRTFLVRAVSGIGPLVGGLLITNFGYSALFIVSLVLLIMSGLPIFLTVNEKKHSQHDIKKICKKYILNKKYTNTTLSMIGGAIEDLIFMVFWSVLIFIVLRNFNSIGFVKSLALVTSSVLALYVGHIIDTKGPEKIHKFGVIVNTLLYIPRLVLTSPFAAYTVELADKLNGTMYTLPRIVLMYRDSEHSSVSDFLIYRELVIHGVKAIAVPIVIVFVFLLPWRLLFLVAIIASLLSYFIEFDN